MAFKPPNCPRMCAPCFIYLNKETGQPSCVMGKSLDMPCDVSLELKFLENKLLNSVFTNEEYLNVPTFITLDDPWATDYHGQGKITEIPKNTVTIKEFNEHRFLIIDKYTKDDHYKNRIR